MAEAEDVEMALKQTMSHQPDFLLLDVSMPGGSGLDIIPRVLETARTTRVIVVSAADAAAMAGAALALGASHYIEKGDGERLRRELLQLNDALV